MTTFQPDGNKYQSQVSQDNSLLIDLTALWDAAGRPEDCSPWAWAKHQASLSDAGRVLAAGESWGGPVLVPKAIALEYALDLDRSIESLKCEEVIKRIAADPAGSLINRPTSALASLIVGGVAMARGVQVEEAAKMLIGEVVERTADLDPFQQETVVARAQRAIRNEPCPIDDLPSREE